MKWVNPFSTKPIKWSNTLKQFVGKNRQLFLSVFDSSENLGGASTTYLSLNDFIIGNVNTFNLQFMNLDFHILHTFVLENKTE